MHFLHCESLAAFLLPSWPSSKIEMGALASLPGDVDADGEEEKPSCPSSKIGKREACISFHSIIILRK